jgi:hypothetical protein
MYAHRCGADLATKEIWRFRTANFVVVVTTSPDHDVDYSFDETGEIRQAVEDGDMVAFQTDVSVRTSDGHEIGAASLCGSIYEDPAQFRDHVGLGIKSRRDGMNYGSYFTQKVREAIDEARCNLRRMQSIRVRDVEPVAPAPGM